MIIICIDVYCYHAKVDKISLFIILQGGIAVMSLEGKKAPEFTLEGSDGRSHTLGEYAGKTVVIFFYP
jgi:peroxiredoxin Q/BCP